MKFSVPALVFLLLVGAACTRHAHDVETARSEDASVGAPLVVADAGTLTGLQRSVQQPRSRVAASTEICLDAWLERQGLDRYGSAKGTMYAGGTPLFNERTGERKDRIAFVLESHPEARNACNVP